MASDHGCARCGASATGPGVDGLCPRCLLRLGLDEVEPTGAEDLSGEPTFALESIECDRPAAATDGTAGFTVDLAKDTFTLFTIDSIGLESRQEDSYATYVYAEADEPTGFTSATTPTSAPRPSAPRMRPRGSLGAATATTSRRR